MGCNYLTLSHIFCRIDTIDITEFFLRPTATAVTATAVTAVIGAVAVQAWRNVGRRIDEKCRGLCTVEISGKTDRPFCIHVISGSEW